MFIPVIVSTLFGLTQFQPFNYLLQLNLSDLGVKTEEPVILNLHPIIWTLLSLIYIRVEHVVGTLTWLAGLTAYSLTAYLKSKDESHFGGHLFQILVALHLFGWVTQFVGHGLFECK